MARKHPAAKHERNVPEAPGRARALTIGGIIGAAVVAAWGAAGSEIGKTLFGRVSSAASSARAALEDRWRPLPEHQTLVIDLRFYPPQRALGANASWMEGLSTSMSTDLCRRPGGHSFGRPFADRNSPTEWYTDVIVSVNCRRSGRTRVTLMPQSGAPTVVYEGIPSQWEQHAFPGIPGSYPHGVVVSFLEGPLPSGPMVPVNGPREGQVQP